VKETCLRNITRKCVDPEWIINDFIVDKYGIEFHALEIEQDNKIPNSQQVFVSNSIALSLSLSLPLSPSPSLSLSLVRCVRF
jgi:hypothetical protein